MKQNKLLAILCLLLLSMPFVAADIKDIFATGGDVLNYLVLYQEFSSFLLIFTILTAVFVLGTRKAAEAMQWTGNAPTVLAVALSVAASIGVWLAWGRGALLFTEQYGRVVALLLLGVVFFVIGHAFYKKRQEKSAYDFLLLALGILVMYHIVDGIFPDFTDNIGGLGTIVDAVVGVSWLAVVFGGFYWLYNTFGAPFGALKLAKKPISGELLAERKAREAQEEELEKEKALKDEKKERRIVRRKIKPYIEDIQKTLDKLQDAATKKNALVCQDLIKKIGTRDSKVRVYVELFTKLLRSTFLLSLTTAENTDLKALKNDFLAKAEELKKDIASLNKSIIKLPIVASTTSTGLWGSIGPEITKAKKTLGEVETHALGILALEESINKRLGRA